MTIAVAARRDAVPLGAIFFVIAVVVAAAVALLSLDRLPLTVCTFKAVTGWPCFTCGTTRAVARLAAGDLRGAFSMNPLATVAAIGLVPWGIADLVLLARGRAVQVEVAPRGALLLRVLIPLLLVANWAYLVAAGR